MRTEKSAGVIVFRRGKSGPEYLLLQNSSKFYWDFAKGNIEQGESDEVAALRELEEESGLKRIEIIPGFKETINYFYRFKGEPTDKTVVLFLGEEKNQEDVKLSWEHSKFEWVPFGDAKSMLKTHKKDVIEKAHNFLSSRLGNWTEK